MLQISEESEETFNLNIERINTLSKRLRWIFIVGVIAIVTIPPLVSAISSHTNHPSRLDFKRHFAEYDNVVKAAKRLNTLPGQTVMYAPNILWKHKPKPFAGSTEGHVWVARANDGSYTVTILTDDEGHSGCYGYVYSDTPNSEITTPLHNVDEQLNLHWRQVEDDGD